MSVLNLSTVRFPLRTTDEEKIIFAPTRGFTIRQIKSAFHFGSTKITKTIRSFRVNGTIPSTP